MKELRNDRQGRGSLCILNTLVVKILVHQLSNNICHLYHKRHTRQKRFDDLFYNLFQLYETGQLIFVKDASSEDMDYFCQGVLEWN